MLFMRAAKELRDYELDVSLSVGPGETLVLIGENGAGKSTVLNLASGLLAPDRGEIALAGRVLYSDAQRIDVPVEDRNIGHLFQSYALFPHLSVFENVAFGLRCRKVPAAEIAARVAGETRTPAPLRPRGRQRRPALRRAAAGVALAGRSR
jgi:ABC-type sulfate/molybdate transport systems ATPase subunit